MSIDSYFYLDTSASRTDVRDILVQANIGLSAAPDWKQVSRALSESTLVTIRDDRDGDGLHWGTGVFATRIIGFGFRKKSFAEYNTQTTRGAVALLKAFPDADAFLLSQEFPLLLRRGGRLVLSQAKAAPGYWWDPALEPSYVAMVDLPHTIEPLGPWGLDDVSPADLARYRAPR